MLTAALGFLAVVLGALIGVGGVLYGNRHSDMRALRDQRAARLRAAFGPLLRSTETLPAIVSGFTFTMGEESVEQRDKRLNALLKDSTSEAGDAFAALALEPGIDAASVREHVEEAFRAFTNWRVVYASRVHGEARLREVTAAEEAVRATSMRVREAMQDVLDQVDQPVGLLPLPHRDAKRR